MVFISFLQIPPTSSHPPFRSPMASNQFFSKKKTFHSFGFYIDVNLIEPRITLKLFSFKKKKREKQWVVKINCLAELFSQSDSS
jgi:hypothetical protein